LSSSSSRDRLTTSELHPPRSPPRLFPRLLHRSAQFTSLHERSPRPPIGVHPQQTAASTSGYLPIRRPRFQQLRIDHASRFSEKLLRPFSSRTISRTSVRRTRTHAGSLDPYQGRSLLVPKRPHRSSRPRALSVPSRATRFPIHPTPLRHSVCHARQAAHIFRWSLRPFLRRATTHKSRWGWTRSISTRRFLARSLLRSLAFRSLFLRPSSTIRISCTPHHVAGDHHRSSATRHRVFLPRPAPLPPNSHDPHPLPSLHRALRVSGIDTRNVDLGGETVFR
jgi:hypothetical protein